jgi:diguanylate cyclase (GGDEF)-like protein
MAEGGLPQYLAAPPARVARVLLALLLAGTAAAALLLPPPLAVAPAILLAALAGVWCERLGRLVLPLLGGAALAPGTAGRDLAVGAVLAAVLVGQAWLVARCSAAASASRSHALRAVSERADDVRAAQQSQQELVGQLHYWSTHDALTGLLNRSAFLRLVDAALATGQPTGVLVVSVAGFTGVNEQLGDRFGDAALTELARRLVATARGGDIVARLGGDSFGVLLSGMVERDAPAVAKRLVDPLAQPLEHEGGPVGLRVRSGVAAHAGGAEAHETARSLVRAAEAASRRCTAGQPTVVVGSAHPVPHQQENGLTEADLARGLEADELFLLYQPLVSGTTGLMQGVEALVRWRHPVHGLVPPDKFIGLAERTGLIVPLGLKVLELAVAQLRAWTLQAPALTIAVNVSARQLVEPGFVEDVRRVLWSSGVDPTRVVLELTESLLVDDSEAAVAVLWQLRGLGLRLALDDFGTGYSSLARLGDLPLDEMKIDKSFVDRLGALPRDSATLVTAAVAMGQGLGLEVVAEGVETAAQAAFLREVGCDLLQGYLLGKPQPADDIATQFNHLMLPKPGSIPAPRPQERVFVPQVQPSAERR